MRGNDTPTKSQELQEWKLDQQERETERYKKGEITNSEFQRRLKEIGTTVD